MDAILEKISRIGIVPVIKIDRIEDAEPLAKALCEGGLPVAEVTFRTEHAKQAMQIINEKFPDMILGAGTVLTTRQVDDAIEAGAKNGIFPVDEVCREYLKDRVHREWTAFEPDEDAEYSRTVTINLDELDLTVSLPHLPENTKPAAECGEMSIDQVVIGSCTNGRISDMRVAAQILKGHRVSDKVRCIVIPGTQQVVKDCLKEGLVDIFIDAGAIFTMPTCGPCLGGYMGILAEGERCVATTNRNFVGRMGHVKSEVYLASPAVAAASAIRGKIADPASI